MLQTDLFTTTPQSVEFDDSTFPEELQKIAKQSEKYGYKGTLIYSDNRLADPWTVTTFILEETENLLPMLALQPAYMHPYTVATKIASLGLLYGRQISLNLIAGGFKNDLEALGDHTEHDQRYERLIEYTEIIQGLLENDHPISYDGDFYTVSNLKLQPKLADELQPVYYLSGSSDAAQKSAEKLGAKLIEYPEPHETYAESSGSGTTGPKGIRIGILARESHDKAWADAHERFPKTRKGAMTHKLAQNVSDSTWHEKLSEQSEASNGEEPVYWLGPFEHYHTFCPYLVGNYEEVSEELSHYVRTGCKTVVLDIPVSEAELQHTLQVFEQAEAKVLQ